MVVKGSQTRQVIIARTAALLNQKGFAAMSLTDIMAATGLEKGGIYNHFASKDELALAAFDYAISLTWERIRESMRQCQTPGERLIGLAQAYRQMADDPPLPGGCPLLNTGIEAPDVNAALRDRARAAMSALLRFIDRLIARGQESGEVCLTIDRHALPALLIGMIEGGVFLGRLYDDPRYVHRAVDAVITHLRQHVLLTPDR